MNDLIAFINTYQKLNLSAEQAIRDCFVEEHVKKNDFVLEKGKVCSKVSFIKSGLVRRFYLNEDGDEQTIWLYHDKHWISSMASFFWQKPSLEYLQACEDTTLFSLSFEDEQKLLELPQFKDFDIKFLRSSLAAFDEFHFSFETMSARNKYAYLIKSFPLMIQKAKQMHIASLLNVSQETLSRIRASIN